MKGYTLVGNQAERRGDRYEALYSRGRLIAQSEEGGFTAAALLEALTMDTIAVTAEYVEVDAGYDEEVVAMDGWPEELDSIPQEVRT